ncbi:MoxR family ATPase [Candidatus Woesearchaeota archaeon]|nr:MAG: MoxR family ATPase [Candidatus Woesearchaeota archaeon]
MEKEDEGLKERAKHYQLLFDNIRKEIAKLIVGQQDIVDSLIQALLCNGHVLIEGVPGIGKTMLMRSLAQVTGGVFSRIQFTPDLLPTDIVGITTYEEGRGFFTLKGPVFANFVLADEINRSPPKVQSALLQAMQERQVTIGKETFSLPEPFFVMATQNPLEQLGTYKLPEAQIDRFLFKLIMTYPTLEEEQLILTKNTTLNDMTSFNIQSIISPDDIVKAQAFIKQITLSKRIESYIVRIVDATRHPKQYGINEYGKYINFGASPRSSIALFIASKAHALIKGRTHVTPQDVKDVAYNILRHRILLNFEGEAEDISTDSIIKEILDKVHIL